MTTLPMCIPSDGPAQAARAVLAEAAAAYPAARMALGWYRGWVLYVKGPLGGLRVCLPHGPSVRGESVAKACALVTRPGLRGGDDAV